MTGLRASSLNRVLGAPGGEGGQGRAAPPAAPLDDVRGDEQLVPSLRRRERLLRGASARNKVATRWRPARAARAQRGERHQRHEAAREGQRRAGGRRAMKRKRSRATSFANSSLDARTRTSRPATSACGGKGGVWRAGRRGRWARGAASRTRRLVFARPRRGGRQASGAARERRSAAGPAAHEGFERDAYLRPRLEVPVAVPRPLQWERVRGRRVAQCAAVLPLRRPRLHVHRQRGVRG